MNGSNIFRAATSRWTTESVGRLSTEELRHLRENALRLSAEEVVELCDAALNGRGKKAGTGTSRASREKLKLVSRRTVFQMRGVNLQEGMRSWGGVRQSDGIVVMSLWADDIRRENGGCSYLLWAPNEGGARPWSDTPGGKERLKHCKLAQERGGAEAILVYGQRQEGFLPEERAKSVKGADPDIVVRFQVLLRGEEYWAVWGGKA